MKSDDVLNDGMRIWEKITQKKIEINSTGFKYHHSFGDFIKNPFSACTIYKLEFI